MPGDTGSKPSDRGLEEQFLQIATDVAEGGLVMPAPFDLASAAALAVNSDSGDAAEGMFAVTAARESKYEVRIIEIQDVDLRRELVDTTCTGQGPLFQLLEDVMDELEARRPD